MAGHEADFFIRKIMHAASLWDDVSDEFMALLKSAFLVGLVRITVEDTRPALAVSCHLNRPGIQGSLNSGPLSVSITLKVLLKTVGPSRS